MNTATSKDNKVRLHKRFNLYYLYDSEGVLWLNIRNLSQLVGEGSRIAAPLHHITRKLPKEDKLINNPYGNKNGALYIKEKQVKRVKERIKNTNLDNTLINSLESSVENIKEINSMNKHLNTLKFQNSNDQPSEVKWFVDDDQVVWYDSVDILFNLGFTKQGFTIKEEIGKIYLERNEPKKLRAGRIHWNKESISVLKEIVDGEVVNDFWDNIEIIFNLVSCEIEKDQDKFNKLLDEKCHLSQDLSPQELNHLYSNGWYKTKCQYHIPLYKKGNIVYNREETTVRECIEDLKMREGFDSKLEDLHNNLDILTDGRDKVSIKHIGYKEFSYAEDYLKSKGFVNESEWGIMRKGYKDVDLVKYAGFLDYKGDLCFNFKAFKKLYKVDIGGDDSSYHKFLRVLKSEGFSRKTRLGTPVYMESGNHNTSKVFNAYSDFANSHNLTVTTKDEDDNLYDYSTLETTYIRKDEGEIVYEHEGVTYVRTSKLEDDERTSVVKYLTHTLKFKPCKKSNITVGKKMQVTSNGCYEQDSSKVGCSKSEIDTFINHLEDQDSVGNEVEMPCKEEKPIVEFLPTPTKTIKYKELVSSKGWWVFKKEVWEAKEVDVYEDEVDSFVSSLTNNCEIIEIK